MRHQRSEANLAEDRVGSLRLSRHCGVVTISVLDYEASGATKDANSQSRNDQFRQAVGALHLCRAVEFAQHAFDARDQEGLINGSTEC